MELKLRMKHGLQAALITTAFFGQATQAILLRRHAGAGMQTIPLRNIGNKQYFASVRMGPEGSGQLFNFGLSTTLAYTVVAGKGCTNCADSSAPRYDPAVSSTFQAPTDSKPRSVVVDGKNATGPMGIELCAMRNDKGGWWTYKDQRVIVADSNSSPSFLTGSLSGLAGLGQSAVQAASDSLIGQFFVDHPNDTDVTYGFALKPTTSTDGSDSSGGVMHMFGEDHHSREGELTTVRTVPPDQQESLGSVPFVLGSFDWTVQMQNWTFQSNQYSLTGGRGVYATIEPAYPYIMLTQNEVAQLYSGITGARRDTSTTDSYAYTVPCGTSMSLSMSFGGLNLILDPKTLYTQIGDTCYGNVRGWNNTAFTTYVMGSAFFRSVYVVYTANPSQQNSIGFAPLASGQSSANQGAVIAAGILGGILFMGLCALGAYLWIRRKRRQQMAPSKIYSTDPDSPTSLTEKALLGFTTQYETEPWAPPPEPTQPIQPRAGATLRTYRNTLTGEQITVGPAWLDPEEQALLAPAETGYEDRTPTVATLPYSAQPFSPQAGDYDQQKRLSSQYATYGPTNGGDPTSPALLSGSSYGTGAGQPFWIQSRAGDHGPHH